MKFYNFTNMKQQLFFIAAVLFFFCGFVQAQDGLSCETAIPVDTSYVGSVPAAGTYYYTASTYDLPMMCYFYPAETGMSAPKVYVDFTCTPGYYEDPNLASMIQSASGWGIKTPIEFFCNYGIDENNREYYSLSINESYREIMATFNITYNVDAIVKVVVAGAGDISMRPDTTFKSCVENSEWLTLPDTVAAGLLREADSYVLPFAEWQNDSIRFRWTGSKAPVTVWIGETCDFEFNTTGDNCALDMFVLSPDAGNGENIRVFTKQDIADYISAFGEGGVYYLRTVCAEDGELIVEKKPMSEEMQKAQSLALEQSAAVAANDKEQVYYFPKEWANYNVIWTSASDYQVTAYFANNVTFAADETHPSVVATYKFAPAAEGRELALSKKQMKEICDNVTGDHVFVKFVAAQKTQITPVLWGASPCVENADEIYVNDSIRLQRNASTTAWRVNIAQWAQQDVKLYWKGTSSIKMFLCDTCKGFTLNKTNQHVKLYKEVSVNTDGTRDTLLLTKDELASVAQYADGDGFLYFRFNNAATGSLIVKAEVSEQEPPIIPEPETAKALVLDEAVDVLADDIEHVYYFTKDWANLSVEFEANSADSITAYFGKTADFNIFGREADYVAAYPFYVENNQSRLQFSAKQINTLLSSNATDTLFVVFYSYNATQVTPMLWHVCACVENSMELMPVDRKVLLSLTYNDVYRVKYSEWQKHDVRLHWNSDVALRAYLADTCDFKLTPKNKHVLNKSNVDILPNDTMIIGEEVRTLVINEGRLPDDGFLYFRFYSQDSGILTTSYPGSSDPGNNPGTGTGVDNTVVGDALRRIICTPDGTIYILVGEDRYTILGEKLQVGGDEVMRR